MKVLVVATFALGLEAVCDNTVRISCRRIARIDGLQGWSLEGLEKLRLERIGRHCGKCDLQSKRGAWPTPVPTKVSVRKSDDALRYDCETTGGRKAVGSNPE